MWRRGAAHPLWRREGGRAAAGSTTGKLALLKRAGVGGFPDASGRYDARPHGHRLPASVSQVGEDIECRQRQAKGESHSMQNFYLHDLVDCVRPIAQSLSWVWQDTNQKPSAQNWQE